MVGHIPVQLREVIDALAPKAGERILDGTFGGGGYSRAILEAAPCLVFGIDRDPEARMRADALKLEADFDKRFAFTAGRFSEMDALAGVHGWGQMDGVVLDIGVSSFQLDQAERGFSFQHDGPLDMRMSCEGESAADVVNTYSADAIANILYVYGDERKSRQIAAAIVRTREEAPFETTKALADVVEGVLGRPRPTRGGKKPAHPATRTFQALRIHVNNELGELAGALSAAERLLKPGGRLVVVTFHSLEDRLVKTFMAERSGLLGGGSRHLPQAASVAATFDLPYRKAVPPSEEEREENPRARSAKLRLAVRTDEPARSASLDDLWRRPDLSPTVRKIQGKPQKHGRVRAAHTEPTAHAAHAAGIMWGQG